MPSRNPRRNGCLGVRRSCECDLRLLIGILRSAIRKEIGEAMPVRFGRVSARRGESSTAFDGIKVRRNAVNHSESCTLKSHAISLLGVAGDVRLLLIRKLSAPRELRTAIRSSPRRGRIQIARRRTSEANDGRTARAGRSIPATSAPRATPAAPPRSPAETRAMRTETRRARCLRACRLPRRSGSAPPRRRDETRSHPHAP